MTDRMINTAAGADLDWRAAAYVTVRKAAVIFGVSRSTIYALHHQGELTLRRIGGRTVVPVPDVLRLVDSAPEWTPSTAAGGARRHERAAAEAAS